ncbi:transcriptional regulator [Colwellia sp. MT41]|uniref:Beta-lactamase regulator AmpE n=1 Tax=Colwellia marinimaniae TaxID=1513592 RepID=A0ABQ0MWJ1_9GAMM|nr:MULTISPECIES: beta-lactamase regulator AmpE [Colwellia]ALO36270.1 transcriptional regulator [Colwellia sp. MT41]GAW96607.1 beta-lactamase regulator AmpE [Colwellia marinimaniae]
MSLLSLLIALAAERSLSAKVWRFNFYYQHYLHFFSKNFTAKQGTVASAVFIILPVMATYFLLELIDNSVMQLVISTLVLIVCFGCTTTRKSYKSYLHSAFRGEETTTAMHHQQLLSDKNLPNMGFGPALIWLNYRYYIAIMLYFTVFGAAGAVFYRLLTSVIEHKKSQCIASENENKAQAEANSVAKSGTEHEAQHEGNVAPTIINGCQNHHDVLYWLDWVPVRVASFGYMFVGHFSKAMPVWLDSLFDSQKPTHQILIDVAQKSEDIIVNEDDCTAEPCLLVRLAKRNVLLVLAVISILTLAGLLN